jgi:hypothetical protein
MKTIRTALAAGICAAAIAAPAAVAALPPETAAPTPAAESSTPSPPDRAARESGPTPVAGAGATSLPPHGSIWQVSGPAPRPIVADTGGFDWTDAGVGFAVALGFGLVGAGALVARRRQPDVTPAIR